MILNSIRTRTLGAALVLFIGASALIAWTSFNDAAHEVEELYDAHLAQQARLLGNLFTGLNDTSLSQLEKLRLLSTLEELNDQEDDRLGHPYESKVVFQVWQDDVLILRSFNAPPEKLTDNGSGYSDVEANDAKWRVFVLPSLDGRERIVIAEQQEVRGELVTKIALRSLLPELLGVPLLAILLWWAIGYGLKPLEQLAARLHSRDPRSLQPLPEADLPVELDTIQQAINVLLAQLKELLEREQQFIADAAHELRTPLSVLSLHSQNALASDTEADRHNALLALKLGIDRTTRVVSQLLTLARLDPDNEIQKSDVDLLMISRQVLADLAPLAWQQHSELLLEPEDDLDWHLTLEPGSLDILLKNLVGNALNHAGQGGNIEVRWQALKEKYTLTVCDHGPGVTEPDKALLLQRFYRGSAGAGAGLGLSIVARIVERHRGTLTLLDTAHGGLSVRIDWPRDRLPQA
ncbi:ATP-binding protein [Saccharospirillum impatiens]|uniref:ATP-binding protein n=1 Tax=Saccharospirillum impatiens TaxID=169438 RepID=UPI00040971A3|nr:ATP-binding protein [Saccharospirillum impatiens]